MRSLAIGIVVGLALLPAAVFGARMNRIGPDGTVGLPYVQTDTSGAQWIVFPGGWVRQNPQPGFPPLYGQAETLTVNGNPPGMIANFGKIDNNTGELVISGINGVGCTVTRRILINSPEGF